MSTDHRESELDRELDDLIETALSGHPVPPAESDEKRFAQMLTTQAQAVHMDPQISARLKAQFTSRSQHQRRQQNLQRSPLPRDL